MANAQRPALRESRSVHIGRDPADVWDYVSDLARTPQWRTTVTSIDPPEGLEAGTRFVGTTRLLGHTWRWVLELTEVDPGRTLGYAVVKGFVKLTVSYAVEPDADGTCFTMTGAIDHVGFVGRLLKPFALPALRRQTAAHLASLKRILEAPERWNGLPPASGRRVT